LREWRASEEKRKKRNGKQLLVNSYNKCNAIKEKYIEEKKRDKRVTRHELTYLGISLSSWAC